jgi:hypothetical protein
LVLRAAFFFPEPFPTLQDGALALVAKSKIAKSRIFNVFQKHLSGPPALLCLILLVSSPPLTGRHRQPPPQIPQVISHHAQP